MKKEIINEKIIYLLFQLMLSLIIFCMFPNITEAAITTVGDYEDFSSQKIEKWVVPYTGIYKLEVWGAQGGNSVYNSSLKATGGYGGYSFGNIKLEKGMVLNIVVGGAGESVSQSSGSKDGGYNGGGKAYACTDNRHFVGSGGGATHIAITAGLLKDLENNKESILIVAGGGGGAYYHTSSYIGTGGSGGGLIGGQGTGNKVTGATGGTQDSVGTGENKGLFGQGAGGPNGGGGGYYGGGSTGLAGAGGGSGYLSPKLISGTTDTQNGVQSGNGYAKITLLRNLSTDARIDTVTISGTNFNTVFDKDTDTYNLVLDSENSTITVDAAPVDKTTEISGLGTYEIPVGTSTITLTGTSEAGTTEIYTINVTRPSSSYKYLKDIQIDGKSIDNFEPTTLTYDITFPYTTTTFNLSTTKGKPNQIVNEPTDLKVTTTVKQFEIVVVSEDGQNTTTYTLNVSKEHNTKLKTLTFDGFNLEPNFDPETLSYKLSLNSTTTSLNPSYTTYDEEATVRLDGFNNIIAGRTAKITVTAPDSSPTEYTIELVKEVKYEFGPVGSIRAWAVPYTGYYQLEVWGGKGGYGSSKRGGLGGYATGVVRLTKNDTLYIVVGGQGNDCSNGCTGGYNGGGNGSKPYASSGSAGGGGATHIATKTGLLKDLENDKSEILIVAGGGGGGHYTNGPNQGMGGHGGGFTGMWPTGLGSDYTYAGRLSYPGTQTAAGCANNGNYCGGFGFGGSASGGGGAGFYGGSGAGLGPGAGGSGYIGNSKLISYKDVTKSMYCLNCTESTDANTYTVSTTNYSETPESYYAKLGNGYAVVTLLEVLNTDARIDTVNISGTNFNEVFDKDTNIYNLVLDSENSTITVDATPVDSFATISGTGTFDIPAGSSTITLTGTSESGTTAIYTINITRPHSPYKYLKDIQIDGKTIDNFNPSTLTYNITVPYSTVDLDLNIIKGRPSQSVYEPTDYTVPTGTKKFEIVVVSEDGQYTTTYTLNITKPHSSKLSSLIFEGFNLDPEFDPETLTYKLPLLPSTLSLKPVYTTFDDEATVKLEGFGYIKTSGTAKITVTEPNSSPSVYTIELVKDGLDAIPTFEFSCTEEVQTFIAPYSAHYRLETWGAQGGVTEGYGGGYGGYATGVIELEKDDILYVVVGCQGAKYDGGYNGGGKGAAGSGQWAYGGGGATHIATKNGLLKELENYKNEIIIVAGGGGGNGGVAPKAYGGSGGGYRGLNGYDTVNRSYSAYTGSGASQTAAGFTSNSGAGRGSFGQGGNYHNAGYGGAGGGGGYYGGGGSNRGHGGGGGGSGYIGSTKLLTYRNVTKAMYGYKVSTSNNENTYTVSTDKASESAVSYYAKEGDGFARISLFHIPSENNFLSSITVKATNYQTEITTTKSYTPDFDLVEEDYYVTLDELETKITLIARPEDSSANIKGLGTYEIQPGTTIFPITVTSEAGGEKIYKVHVTRPASSDEYPLDITISGLVPSLCNVGGNDSYCKAISFDPNTKEYELIVPYRIKQLQFDVHKGHPFQTVSGEGKITLKSGLNEIVIDVTSEDGTKTVRYTYRVTRDMTGDTDIAFKLLGPEYEINFDPDILEYYVTVDNSYDKYMYVDGNAEGNINKTPDELKDEALALLQDTIQMYIKTDDENAMFIVRGPDSLETGMNEVQIIVTANSGDVKTYVIHIYRLKNTNTFLRVLEVTNTNNSSVKYSLNPEFDKLKLGEYQVVVENDIEEVNIVAETEASTSTAIGDGIVKLNVGSNKVMITVTAEDVGETETYTLDIVRKKNSNNYLSGIRVFDDTISYTLNPIFNKETPDYSVDVLEGVEKINIEATPEVATTTYKLLDSNTIKVGENIKRVMAIAEDGSNRIYTIKINRVPSTNNYISVLIVKNGDTEFTLSPEFDKKEENYTLTVENEINNVEISATLENYLTKVSGTGKHSLSVGENEVSVTTLAEDGNSRTYTIVITRKPNSNAYLKGITLSDGVLDPIFEFDKYKYTVNVGNEVENITIMGIPEKNTTTITGNGIHELKTDGKNIITLTTLAEDGISTETYEIEVIRDKSNNTNLDSLWMEEGRLVPEFKPQTLNYTARVPYDVTKATFHVKTSSASATYEILGNVDNLSVGENEIIIRVKSEEDPDNIYKDYKVVVTRQEEGSVSSYLSSLTVSNGTLTPEFKKETTYYEVDVPYEVDKVKISASSEDNHATVSGTGEKKVNPGENLFTITVTAIDGESRDYQVMIRRDMSNEARLQSLIIDGSSLDPMFDKDTYEYHVTTTNSFLEFISIKTLDERAFFTLEGNNFEEKGEHIVTIEVTAPDMKTKKTYQLIVNKEGNNNNDLEWLEVEGYELTPSFQRDKTVYRINVPKDVNSVNVIARAANNKSSVEGSGIQTINVGNNQIEVKVTSESGKEKVYTIIVLKEGNNDNTLKELEVLNGTMNPSFDGRSEYNVEVNYIETSIDLKVVLSDPNASYVVLNNNLSVGINKVTVAVIAENGEVKNYLLNVTRKEIVSALLEDLIISNYQPETAFNSYITSYDVIVNYETESLDLTPIPLDKHATWRVSGNENFVVGDNTVTIEVTASDNKTKETYTLNVKRQKEANTYLDYLYTDKGDLSPLFNKATMEYSIDVPYETESIELIGEAQDKSTTVTGLGEHELKTGKNVIPVTVMHQNGVKRVYYVTVNRSKNDDNFLASLIAKVGGLTYDLDPEFSEMETEYTIEVPIGTPAINLIGTLSSDAATVEGLGIHTLQAGKNEIIITVTSESGKTREYKITVNRPASDSNYLIELIPSVGELDPQFSYDENKYTLNLDSSKGVLSFDAIPEDPNATVSGHESEIVPDGTSTRIITVTAEDGSKKEYIITINKERTDNALLKDLYVIGYPFDDGVIFSEDNTEYHITVPNNKQILLASEIMAETDDKNATITKSGNVTLLTSSEIEYAVTVTAPNGFTKKTYIIKVAREKSSNALLSLLKVNVGYLKETFNPTTYAYTWVVPKRTNLTPESVLAVAQDIGAKIEKTASIIVTSDTTEEYIIKVISEDGTNETEYVIKIEADVSSDKTLSSLTIDKGYYTPELSEETTEFDVYEYEDIDSINVLATPNNEDSKVTSGNGEVILTNAETRHIITVTAEDGTTENYVLKIHRTIKRDAGLRNLGLNGLDEDYCDNDKCVLSKPFETGELSYQIKVPYEYQNLDILAEKMNEQQTIKYKIGGTYITDYELPLGVTIVEIEVYDGMNKLTRTYTLEIERCTTSNNYLKSLAIGKRNLVTGDLDLYELEPGFNKKIQEYTIYVDKDVEEVEIYGEPELEGNPVSINGYNYLQEGNNDATVTVVAPSGKTRVYIIHIVKSSDYNSMLKNIYVSTGSFWDLSPKFKSTTFDYVTTITGPHEKATINAVPVMPTTVITGTGGVEVKNENNVFTMEVDLKVGSNVVTLVGTSYDDDGNVTSSTTYKVNVIKTPSINVDLENLIVEEGTLDPTFNSGTTKYNISVGSTINKLTIYATPKDRTSSIRITGNENLVSGYNYVNVIVMNKEKTASKTYQLLVYKAKSENSKLKDIKVYDETEEFSLKPEFKSEETDYLVKVPHTKEKVSVLASVDAPYATVIGNGDYYLDYGHNIKHLIVTSESGTTTTYTVDIFREYDLYLKSLEIDEGELTPEFDKETLTYRVELPYEIKNVNIKAEANSNKVELTGDGRYSLKTGENTIEVITKDPEDNKRIHTIIINREKNDNNYIKELTVEGYLDQEFEKTIEEYTVNVRKDVTSLKLHVELEAEDSSYEILDNSNFTESKNPNKVTIRVTAENGDTRDYILNVYLQPDEFFLNRLLDLKVDQGKLAPDFNPDINNYTVVVANSIDKITITTIKENQYSKVTYNGLEDNTVSLALGRNVIEVVVTSQEGFKNTYFVIVYREDSNDASLTSLEVKGFNLLPIFTRNNLNYSLDVGGDTTSLEINAVPYDPKSTVEITGHDNIKTGTQDVKILVTAPDGVTKKEYIIKVTKGISRNNYLSDLNVSGYSFDKTYKKEDQGPYVINVPSNINSVLINAIPEVNTTEVTGDGVIDLIPGQNIITVNATSESGDVRPYTIIINKSKSSDSTLKDIILSDESLEPEFNSKVLKYTVTVPEDLDVITVTGIPNDASSSVVGNDTYSITEDFTISLVVTAADGNKTTYTIDVVRDVSSSSKLASLVVKDGELYPGFHKLITSYTILVPNEVRSLNMTYAPEDKNAQVTVSGNESFKVGTNTVKIRVDSADGSDTTEYIINVVRQSIASNYLEYLEVEGYALKPAFDKTNMYYEVTVPIDVETVKINAEVEDPNSKITSGTGYKSVNKGINRFYVTVESASGVIRTYQIVINRVESSENYLLTLESDVGELSPKFTSDNTSYTLNVPAGTKEVTLSGTASENATIIGLGKVDVNLGSQTRVITVTSESGDVNTYNVEIVRPASTNTELTSLIPSVGNIEYSNDTLEYSIEVSDNQNVISFTATPVDENATLSGTDITSLDYGDNLLEIVVTAEDGITTRVIKVTVKRMKDLISIIPSDASIIITKGESKEITYTLNPSDTSYPDVEWRSTDTTIATVDEFGKITGVNFGSTTVQIVSKHDENIFATINVNVMNLRITSGVYDVVRIDETTIDQDILDEYPNPEDYVIGAEPEMTIVEFIEKFDNDSATLHIFDKDDNELSEDEDVVIGTGMTIKLILDGATYDELKIIVRGDFNGDGFITTADYTKLKNYLLLLTEFNYIDFKAGDLDNDDMIITADYTKIKNYLLLIIDTVN